VTDSVFQAKLPF